MKIKRENTALCAFYAGLALALCVALYIQILVKDDTRTYFTARYKNLIDDVAAQRAPDDLVVYVFGNSRLRNAMAYGASIRPEDNPQTLPDGRRIWWLRFAEDTALFNAYQPIWNDALASDPDYIFIMPYLLSAGIRTDIFSVRNLPVNIYLFFRKNLFNTAPAEIWHNMHEKPVTVCMDVYDQASLEAHLYHIAHRDKYDLEHNENRVMALEALEKAKKTGVDIVMMDVLPNMEALSYWDVPRLNIAYHGLNQWPSQDTILPDDSPVLEWVKSPQMPADHYCDFAHMNAKGRAVFQSWLTETVRRLSSKPPQ